jgi:antitoxin component HigA of HigAB toxin-antitoxin module
LRGKRDLTVKMIKAISKNLRISTETLLGAWI